MKKGSTTFNHYQKFSKASAVLLLASLSIGVTSIVSADSTLPNGATARQITIHAVDQAPTGSNALGNNDGSVLDVTGKQMLEGVDFSAVKIAPLAGKSASSINPLDPNTYTVVGTPITGTTGSDGTVVLPIGTDASNDGYYLVKQETEVGGVTSISPFVVQVPLNYTGTTPDGSWTYDVNVYPKLDSPTDKGSDKLINLEDGTTTDKQATVFSGQTVTWNLATVFSKSMRSTGSTGNRYGTFEIKDQLDTNLTYQSVTFSVGVQDTADNSFSGIQSLTLVAGTDYTISSTDGLVDLKLTPAGIDKVLSALPTPGTDQKAVFIPNITTKVAENYKYGQIGNSFIPIIKNALGVDLSTEAANSNVPSTPPGTDNALTQTPEVYLGGVIVKKIDSISKTPLQGATFKIAVSEADAKAGNYVQQDDAGNLYSFGSVPSGVTTHDYSATTAADGTANFTGLQLTDFKAQGNGTDGSQANTEYYVVETQAPAGYNIPDTPFKVVASIDPTSVTNELNNNLNGGNIKLPFTGGQGMIGILLIASAAAGSAIVIRRRKPSND